MDPAIRMVERSTTGRATLGADRGYDARGFVAEVRALGVTPHVARTDRPSGRSAVDGRTTRHPGYALSQRRRKLTEEMFGCLKAVAGGWRLRYVGPDRCGGTPPAPSMCVAFRRVRRSSAGERLPAAGVWTASQEEIGEGLGIGRTHVEHRSRTQGDLQPVGQAIGEPSPATPPEDTGDEADRFHGRHITVLNLSPDDDPRPEAQPTIPELIARAEGRVHGRGDETATAADHDDRGDPLEVAGPAKLGECQPEHQTAEDRQPDQERQIPDSGAWPVDRYEDR